MNWLDNISKDRIYIYESADGEKYFGKPGDFKDIFPDVKLEPFETLPINGKDFTYAGFLPIKLNIGSKIRDTYKGRDVFRIGKVTIPTSFRHKNDSFLKQHCWGYHPELGKYIKGRKHFEEELKKENMRIMEDDETLQEYEHKVDYFDDSTLKELVDMGAELSGEAIKALKDGKPISAIAQDAPVP